MFYIVSVQEILFSLEFESKEIAQSNKNKRKEIPQSFQTQKFPKISEIISKYGSSWIH